MNPYSYNLYSFAVVSCGAKLVTLFTFASQHLKILLVLHIVSLSL